MNQSIDKKNKKKGNKNKGTTPTENRTKEENDRFKL